MALLEILSLCSFPRAAPKGFEQIQCSFSGVKVIVVPIEFLPFLAVSGKTTIPQPFLGTIAPGALLAGDLRAPVIGKSDDAS